MIGVFFAWWLGQLKELLPSWLRASARARIDALVIAPAGPLEDPGAIVVGLRRGGNEAQLGRFALAAGELRDLPRSPARPTVLRLKQADVLEKTLVLPLAAQAELDQVLAFEMDRETPFRPDELYWNHRVEAVDRQHGKLSIRLLLLPKAKLAALLSTLAQAGIAPRWAEIADAADDNAYLPLDGDGLRPHQRSRRFLRAAAVCCAVLAFGAIVTPFLRQAAQLITIEREVKAGKTTAAQAEALRRQIDRLSGSADLIKSELDKAGRPLDVLATVTRLLPDDTYLTEFDLRQRKVTLSGRSSGAARLIGLLAADSRLHNPAFAAPVTRIEALHAEVFTIVAEEGPAP